MVISCLGIGQIVAWGSSYYLPAVLSAPIAAATGWSTTVVLGGFSLGLLVSGLVSPRVGRLIESRGGRPVLAASATLLAIGLFLLGMSANPLIFVAGWIVIGVGMGAGLYDPAFSTLGRLYGEDARRAITQLTLLGGFASTVCWPISAFLVERVGWRGACLTYAFTHIVLVLPLYLFGVPAAASRTVSAAAADRRPSGRIPPGQRVAFVILAAAFTLASVIMTVVSVYLIDLLRFRGGALAAAVTLGALVGPSQVAGRIAEMTCGRKMHPVWSLIASCLLVLVGLGMLAGSPSVAAAAIILYGCGSGIRSIARGTVPLALFGADGYAVLMGRIALPVLLAQSASPSLGSVLMEHSGPTGMLWVLSAGAVLNTILALLLIPFALRIRSRALGQGGTGAAH